MQSLDNDSTSGITGNYTTYTAVAGLDVENTSVFLLLENIVREGTGRTSVGELEPRGHHAPGTSSETLGGSAVCADIYLGHSLRA